MSQVDVNNIEEASIGGITMGSGYDPRSGGAARAAKAWQSLAKP